MKRKSQSQGPDQGQDQDQTAQYPSASVARNDTKNYENAVVTHRLFTLAAMQIRNRLPIARRR